MARSTPPWIGKTDDTKPPQRVKQRVFDRLRQKCHRCGRTVATGEAWTLEHLVALVNGGANDETNLGITCGNCLPVKNAEDVAEKKKVRRARGKHIGTIRPKQAIASRGFDKKERREKLPVRNPRRLFQ